MAALQLTMCAATGLVLMNAHSSLSRAMALCWLPNTLACYMGISAGTAKLMGMANDIHLYVWGLLGRLLSLSLEFCPLFSLARVCSGSFTLSATSLSLSPEPARSSIPEADSGSSAGAIVVQSAFCAN